MPPGSIEVMSVEDVAGDDVTAADGGGSGGEAGGAGGGRAVAGGLGGRSQVVRVRNGQTGRQTCVLHGNGTGQQMLKDLFRKLYPEHSSPEHSSPEHSPKHCRPECSPGMGHSRGVSPRVSAAAPAIAAPAPPAEASAPPAAAPSRPSPPAARFNGFTHFVPLGADCQASHHLRRAKLQRRALPFDWMLSVRGAGAGYVCMYVCMYA
jgi:hypothetical protein